MKELTQKELIGLLHYDPETGVFTWLERPIEMFAHCKNPEGQCNTWNTKYSGQEAGCKYKWRSAFYSKIGITINGVSKRYEHHRLAFLYMSGNFPSKQVDHIDHNGLNNSWNNLREVSNQENQKNCSIQSNNTSGCTGVSWERAASKWRVSIRANGKNMYGGLFKNIDDAIAKRKELNRQYCFHENHGRN